MSHLFVDMHQRRLNSSASRRSNNKNFTATIVEDENELNNAENKILDDAATAEIKLNGDSIIDNDNEIDANEVYDPLSNILSLKLKKPKNWRWELTTSRSCTNIALPRILLYDHRGQLLADANRQAEETYKEDEMKDAATAEESQITQITTRPRKRSSRASTSSLAQSIRAALDRELNGLQIQEASPTPTNTLDSTLRTSPASSTAIDFYTNDLPDYQQIERRSSSLKSVRFQVDNVTTSKESFQTVDLPTPSTSTSGPREKRRYRRSHSSGRSIRSGSSNNNNKNNNSSNNTPTSESILERFSLSRGRDSSPEYADDMEITQAPRYFLRTSKAGTLVVQHESFSRYRRRRKPKHASTESLSKELTTKNLTFNSTQLSSDYALTHSNSDRRNLWPVCKYRTDDEIIAMHQQRRRLSISEAEEGEQSREQPAQEHDKQQWSDQQRQLTNGGCAEQQRKYTNLRRQSKKDLDSANRVQPGFECSTAR